MSSCVEEMSPEWRLLENSCKYDLNEATLTILEYFSQLESYNQYKDYIHKYKMLKPSEEELNKRLDYILKRNTYLDDGFRKRNQELIDEYVKLLKGE